MALTFGGAPILTPPVLNSVTRGADRRVRVAFTRTLYPATGEFQEYRVQRCLSSCASEENWSTVWTSATNSAGAQTAVLGMAGPRPGDVSYRVAAFNGLDWISDTGALAPAFSSAVANGTSLVITMDETLAAAANLANSAFAVKKTPAGGSEQAVTLGTTAPAINGATVTLTLATALSPTDTDVKVSYTKPDTGSDNKLADTAGNEAATFTAQPVTNIAVPGAPGGLTATPGKVQITLSWTAAAANNSAITNYQYRYKAASGSFGNWTDVPDSDDSGANLDDETSVTVTGLTNGTAYTFEVRAVNGVGDGAAAEVTATTANVPPTAADETFSTKEDSDRAFSAEAFNFSDDDPDDVLAAVKITALLAANTGSLLLNGNAVTLNQTISKADLDAGKLVYMPPANANGTGYAAFSFKVNDGEADSASAYTMTIDVTAVNDAPTVANAIPGQSAMVGTAFSYTIPSDTFADSDTDDTLSYTATLADGGLLPDWLSFAATTRILSGTPPASAAAAPVSVRVTARDADGAGVSAPLVVTVAPAVPEAPQSLAASAGNAQVVLSWSAPSGDGGAAITKYQYRSAQGASVGASVNWNDIPDSADTGSSAADETTVTVSSLTNGTAYAFEVRAVNSAGNGTAASATATPAATDSVAPAVTSITRRVPAASPTNADSLTWRVVFSEAVRNAGSAAFSVTGTGIGTPSVSAAAVSGQTGVHDVTVSGGNLASLTETVTLGFASGQTIQDAAGNALSSTTPTGTNENQYEVDNTAPTVAITGASAISTAPFTATVTFSEPVTGFGRADLVAVNARLSDFTETVRGTVWTARVTPVSNGVMITLEVPAGAAQDRAGNDNVATMMETGSSTTFTARLDGLRLLGIPTDGLHIQFRSSGRTFRNPFRTGGHPQGYRLTSVHTNFVAIPSQGYSSWITGAGLSTDAQQRLSSNGAREQRPQNPPMTLRPNTRYEYVLLS